MQITMEEDAATTTVAMAPTERAAIALESRKTEQHLKTLAAKHASITVVKDKAGREQAHGAYMEVMRARTAVEKAAKDAREDANKFSKAKPAEQPVCAAEHQEPALPDPERAPVPAPVVSLPVAPPVASAIVLAVAEFWLTDNRTAARWITERAAEIETLKG